MIPDKIMLGCAILEAMAPEQPKSQRVIAEACQVSQATIYLIELQAMKKLRKWRRKDLMEFR